MIFQGTFYNRDNTKAYRVTIGKSGLSRKIVDPFDDEFVRYGDKVLFDEDPITITCERDELTQQIIIRQAEIRLMANYDLSSTLFADTNRSIPVIIEQKQGNNYIGVFRGYVDPLQFNQGAVNPYETFTVHATDPLGALEDMKVDKLTYRMNDTPTIKALISDIINAIGCEVDYSKWASSPNKPNDDIVTNMSIFFGESEDDYMTLYDTLQNLLIYQGAMAYYNPASDKVYLMNLYVSNSRNVNFNLKDNAMDASTNLSMSDVYSQIKLKCEIDPIDDEISMFDSNSLSSDYPSYQKYMTELISEGEGRSAFQGMRELVNSTDGQEASTSYESAYRKEHFCWIKKSDQWSFGDGNKGYDKITPYPDQSDYLNTYLKTHRGEGMFVAFGKSNKQDKKDNSPLQNVKMTNYLMIYVDGRYDMTSNDDIRTLTGLYGEGHSVPYICKYTGLSSVTLTPPDRNITNYIVINGKLLLNLIQGRTGTSASENLYQLSLNTYNTAKPQFNSDWTLWHHTIPIKDGEFIGEGSYYIHKFWNCTNPLSPTYTVKNTGQKNPPIGDMELEWNKQAKYVSSLFGAGDQFDTIKKLPILACELKIGDKYCCERLDKGVEGQNVFEWLTASEADSNGIPKYFTIGIDPKIDDYIIGQTFDISNTVDYTMNIDEKGMAIPITIDDKLNGVPEFKILSPVNIMWDSMFYLNKDILVYLLFGGTPPGGYILESIESILMSDLSIKFISDNAKMREGYTTADNDLVYCSDEMPIYVQDNENDIKICTPLTIDECMAYGIKYQISNSYIYHSNNDPFYGWTYSNKTVKPEMMWVDYMYRQYSAPRKILSTSIKDSLFISSQSVNNDIGNWMTYGTINGTIGTSDSNFQKGYITKMIWDVKNTSIEVDIREAGNYSPIWQ